MKLTLWKTVEDGYKEERMMKVFNAIISEKYRNYPTNLSNIASQYFNVLLNSNVWYN